MPEPMLNIDPRVGGPWEMVKCGDCGRVYQCTPSDDHYLPEGEPEGSPRVCFSCLLARNGLGPETPVIEVYPRG